MLHPAHPDIITIELAGDPVAKGRPRFVRATGRTYTPEKTERYESHLRLAAQVAMAGRPLFDGPLWMCIHAVLPIPQSYSRRKRDAAIAGAVWPTKKPDWDNFAKIAADALNNIVFRDDSQIVRGHVTKRYGARPRLTIEVGMIGENG